MGETEVEGDYQEELKRIAEKKLQNAHEIYAYGMAIEDGELEPEEAKSLLEMDELAVVQSEYYPGDEYYDRAASQLAQLI